MKNRWRRVALAILACLGLIGAQAVHAQSTYHFDLPAQSLSSALREVGHLTQTNIVFDTRTLSGLRAAALQGNLTVAEALERLLAGTGLTAQRNADNTVLVRADKAESGPLDPGTAVEALDQVLVTAQKNGEERVQDTPVPVTAVKAETLVDNGNLRLRDYYTRVPGFDVAPNYVGTQNLAIRGVTTGGLANPTVGVMIDEEPFGSSTDHGNSVPDVDPGELSRIEVLRGPQGTLYGSNSMGGLVKFVTIDPSTAGFSGNLSAGASGVDHGNQVGYSLRGSANVPVTDTLAVRVGGYGRLDPGWISNPLYHTSGVNEVHAEGGRVAALWRPTQSISVKLSGLYQHLKSDGNPETVAAPGLGLFQQNYVPGAGWDDRRIQDYAATVKADLGAVKLTSITAYNVNSDRNTLDYTFAVGKQVQKYFPFPNNIYDTNEVDHKTTQETRLNGSIASLDWLAGVFYTHEITIRHTYIHAVDPADGFIVGEYSYAYPGSDEGGDRQYEEYAGFLNLTWHFTDRLDLQVGGRESHNHVFNNAGGITVGPRNIDLGRSDPFIAPAVSAEGTVLTYLVTPEFKIDPDLMVYARFSSGYRPGSPNSILPGIPTQANPDTTENYEGGLKGDFLDHGLSLDASVYYISWHDIQFQLVDPVVHVSYLTNGSAAKSEGVELSVTARPIAGLTLTGWASYDEAVLTQRFPVNSSAYGAVGDRLPMTPKYSANLSAEQSFSLPNDVVALVGADLSYVGERYGQFTSSPLRQEMPGYTQLDLHAGMRRQSWSLNVYVDNVTNSRGMQNGGPGYFYTSAFIYTRPRLVGASVTTTF